MILTGIIANSIKEVFHEVDRRTLSAHKPILEIMRSDNIHRLDSGYAYYFRKGLLREV